VTAAAHQRYVHQRLFPDWPGESLLSC